MVAMVQVVLSMVVVVLEVLLVLLEGMVVALHWCLHAIAWRMLLVRRTAGRSPSSSAGHAWLSCLCPAASCMLLRACPCCLYCHTA